MLRWKPNYRLIAITLGLLLLGGGMLWSASSVHAQATTFSVESIGSQIGLGDADLRQTVINVIRWALGIMILVAVVFIIYGGFIWMTAAGNEDRIDKAKRIILQACIGLVVVLLAWAIVLFVVRNFERVTRNSNENGGCTNPPCIVVDPPPTASFDVTAMTTCATRPDYDTNVPVSSRVAVIFNARPKAEVVKTAVEDINAANPHAAVAKCADGSCAALAPPPLAAAQRNQVFSGTEAVGKDNDAKNEWVLNKSSLTFYHTSFSDNPADPDYHYFDADASWQVSLPRNTSTNALKDERNRTLQKCQRAGGQPIEGDGILGENCKDSGESITWKFDTAPSTADVNGPVLSIAKTVPTSTYLSDTNKRPSRNVSRKPILGVEFNNAIDPARVSLANLRVYKYTTPPNPANGTGGVVSGTPLPDTMFDFDFNSNGTGVWVTLTGNNLLDAFTWYQVKAENFESLCGRAQDPNPFVWTFETNDETPGVKRVYPRNGFQKACPDTRVFIKFNTSMWKPGNADCQVAAGSYVTDGAMLSSAGPPGRNLEVSDPFPANGDPNDYCRMYSFTPESAELKVGATYHVGVNTDLIMDSDGTKLVAGDKPPANADNRKPWSFKVAPADTCFQEPVITRISPSSGPNGACVSVIGHYFTQSGDADDQPEPGDALTLGAKNQSDLLNWENEAIVTTVDRDGSANNGDLELDKSHPYQVTVRHPQGDLPSEPENFRLTSDPASNGPCLAKLSPTKGPVSTLVTATGKRFGDGATGQVLFSNSVDGQWGFSSASWTDTKVSNMTVKPVTTIGQGLVSIAQGGNNSNALPFTVTEPSSSTGDPRVPRVAETSTCDYARNVYPSPNPRPGDTDVCLNSVIRARFNKKMDPPTIAPNNIILKKVSDGTIVSADAFDRDSDDQGFTFDPPRLEPGQTYEVTLTTGFTSAAPDHVPLAAPYVWTFTTQTDNADCPINKLGIESSIITGSTIDATPPTYTFRDPTFAVDFQAAPFSAKCHRLGTGGLQFNWTNSNDTVVELQSNTGQQVVGQNAQPSPQVGSANITVTAQSLTSSPVVIKYDDLACTDSNQCLTLNGQSCGSSTCVDRQCTPVITSIDPPAGAVGTSPVIKGCWFGTYSAGQSKVMFSNDKEGIVPAACGTGSWRNYEIIRTVPTPEPSGQPNDPSNDAVDGKVKVIRKDGATAESPNDFDVDPTKVFPTLCSLNPTRGPVGTDLIINGDQFESRVAGDQATITLRGPNPTVPMTQYTSWAMKKIETTIPTAPQGWSDVRVQHAGALSGSLSFDLRQASSSAPYCTSDFDPICPAGQGCGYDHHCHPRPVITTPTSPAKGSTGICRNAQVRVTLDQPLDAKTVTSRTVRYYDGARVVNGDIDVSNTSTEGTIIYQPGILSPSRGQRLELIGAQEVPMVVKNSGFEAPLSANDWAIVSRASRSPDQPPGHSGQSGLADCTTCPTNGPQQQAFFAQEFAGTNVPGKTYRITGWVKAEVGAGSVAGLVAQCRQGNSNCGYHLSSTVGEFRANSGGWQQISYEVTRLNNGSNDILRIVCLALPGSKVWCDDITLSEIHTDPPTLIRSKLGVLADVTSGTSANPITFTTGADICKIDQVKVQTSVAPFDSYTFITATGPMASTNYSSTALARNQAIQNRPQYSWKWNWSSKDPTIVISEPFVATEASSNGLTKVTAQPKNGRTRVEACAKEDSGGRQICGSAEAVVDLCIQPWNFNANTGASGFTDSNANCDTRNGPGQCQDFHFRMSYCRDQGSLPDFAFNGTNGQLGAIEGLNAADTTRLKSFFFKESPASRDTIGLLIFSNTQLLSPYDWYSARFPADSSASSTTVAGYPAVRTGTTTYIGVTDISGGVRQGLIFVLDYNSNSADAATKEIYERLLKSISFNLGFAFKNELLRDTKRQNDLVSIKQTLEAYKTKNGSYPNMASGSYIAGLSTSVWPSWQNTLGNAVGRTMPSDPLNDFNPACKDPAVPSADKYEAKTCWSETKKAFQCPNNSHLYAYVPSSDGTSYSLYARMEYTNAGTYATSPGALLNPCAGIPGSNCSCFNTKLTN